MMLSQDFLTEHCLYQDDDLLVINKPANLLTIPGKHISDSVLTRLQHTNPNVLLIHRLDRDTSGLLVFALNKMAQREISKQFQERSVHKIYRALVSGHIQGQGTIDIPVIYDESRPPLHKVDTSEKKAAVTHWQVTEQRFLANYPVSLVQLNPITGRSHQLRVHLQYLGHAIVGDRLYADEIYQNIHPILCLQASQLSLTHPRTQQRLCFECPEIF